MGEKVEIEVYMDKNLLEHLAKVSKLAGVRRNTVINVLLAQTIVMEERRLKNMVDDAAPVVTIDPAAVPAPLI